MADASYLVALALLEVAGKRALPLSGKAIPEVLREAPDPGDDGRSLALELMLRIWQRSDERPIQRAAGDNSLLLVDIPLELMSEQLPLLKASWIAGGDTNDVLQRLGHGAVLINGNEDCPHLGTDSTAGASEDVPTPPIGAPCPAPASPKKSSLPPHA